MQKTVSLALLILASLAFSQETVEAYTKQITLVQDSIAATHKAIENVKKNTASSMILQPKGEFEKQPEFDARKAKWEKDVADKIEQDLKPLNLRIAELEKTKKTLEEKKASLYSSVDIKTSPAAASIWLGKDEIGASPAEYKLLIPGTVRIHVRKEGYNPWDTTFVAAPGAKYKINVTLEEKSIFSTENEIDFDRFLRQDATIEGYRSRIATVEARKIQVDEEMKIIWAEFPDTYPTLAPQKPDETPAAFKNRHDMWQREGMRQLVELQKKQVAYKQKLDRTIAVLNDYIVTVQSAVMSSQAFDAKIELGSYDADKEQFEIAVQDSASGKSPFYFKGSIGVPRDTAKGINRSAPGFAVFLQFINYPFENVNLAMSNLQLSKNGMNFKIDGSFSELEQYKLKDGYAEWKLRADSLLSGALKPQGLDYAYVMGKKAAAAAVAEFEQEKEVESSSGLGWRGWTRILTFTAAAACGGVSLYKHSEMRNTDYYANNDLHKTRKLHRNIYTSAAGVFALGGILTFVF
ncbi:MAG: PEGA domain-containing protein [Fibromonadales bacterium]|nr:PEGA domain-containing protein [Fibromonadales bacterium]